MERGGQVYSSEISLCVQNRSKALLKTIPALSYHLNMLQVIGRRKSRETQKAVRYLKERRIAYQSIDLDERDLSEREWKSIFSSLDADDLIDRDSAYYRKNGYEWREFSAEEELVLHPELLRLPILRSGQKAVLGTDEAFIRENS